VSATPTGPAERAQPAPPEPVAAKTGRVARMQTSVHTTWTRIESARGSVPGVDATFAAVGRDQRVGGNLLACAIAYRLFLWLLPTALLMAGILGFLRDAGPSEPSDVARDLGLGAYVASTVGDAAEQASDSRWILVALAVIGLYSTSNGGAKAYRIVYALIWGVPRSKPKHAWMPPLAFLAFAFGTMAVTVGANVGRGQVALHLAFRLALVAVYGLIGLLLSLLLPHGDAPWTRLVPGAIVIALGVQLLHLVTVYYLVGRVHSSSELYGGLGAAATILLWLYLIGRISVAAAVVNAIFWERIRERDGGAMSDGRRAP
jgi:uncharacterized BrkB/YihY/UPF0761 family membrane protein